MMYTANADSNSVTDQRQCDQEKLKYGLSATGVVLLIGIILITFSLSGMEYYEMGFKKRRSTGSVDTSRVYTSGLHALGPDHIFKKFPATANLIVLDNLAVFTSDRLEVIMTVSFQYFLKKSDLDLLHEEYDLYYEPIIISNAGDAIKTAATLFSTREFVSNRIAIERALYNATRLRLGGICCLQGCEDSGTCDFGCLTYTLCSLSDKGFFSEVRYFQLGSVRIPADVEQRFLQALILQEDTEREQFIQQAALVTIETNRQVVEINNLAKEVENNATADAAKLASNAQANATATIESSRQAGLKVLYTALGLDTVDLKRSYDYLQSLRDKPNLHLTVEYNQLIRGDFNN